MTPKDVVLEGTWNRGLDPNGYHVFEIDQVISAEVMGRIRDSIVSQGLKNVIVISCGVKLARFSQEKHVIAPLLLTFIASFLIGIMLGVRLC